MQPLPLSLEEWNHIQSSLEKWNDTENPSYLLHLHFTAEPLWAKWDALRILRWFLNRTPVWSSTVSADGDFSVAVNSRRLVELSLNIHHFLIWIVLWLRCVHSWNDKVSLIAMTALQNRPCVGFFFFKSGTEVIWLTSLLRKVSLIKTNSAKSSTAEVPLNVRKGRQCGCVWLNVAVELACFAFCVSQVADDE